MLVVFTNAMVHRETGVDLSGVCVPPLAPSDGLCPCTSHLQGQDQSPQRLQGDAHHRLHDHHGHDSSGLDHFCPAHSAGRLRGHI